MWHILSLCLAGKSTGAGIRLSTMLKTLGYLEEAGSRQWMHNNANYSRLAFPKQYPRNLG